MHVYYLRSFESMLQTLSSHFMTVENICACSKDFDKDFPEAILRLSRELYKDLSGLQCLLQLRAFFQFLALCRSGRARLSWRRLRGGDDIEIKISVMMLMQPPPQSQSISSLSTDWSSSNRSGRRSELRQLGFPSSSPGSNFPTIHEKKENWKLKQHLLDLKRTMRKHSIDLNSTLLTYPEVESWIQENNITDSEAKQRLEEGIGDKNQTLEVGKGRSHNHKDTKHLQRNHREKIEASDDSS